jgi:hypothetical protein
MCANKLRLCFYLQLEKIDVHGAPVENSRIEKYVTLFCEISPATHSFLLLKV